MAVVSLLEALGDRCATHILARLYRIDGMYDPKGGYEPDHFVTSAEKREAAANAARPQAQSINPGTGWVSK